MRVFWEKLGVLGPIYRLVGQGLSDGEIAGKLNLTEPTVRGCIGWILRFLQLTERKELVWYSSAAAQTLGSRDQLARQRPFIMPKRNAYSRALDRLGGRNWLSTVATISTACSRKTNTTVAVQCASHADDLSLVPKRKSRLRGGQ